MPSITEGALTFQFPDGWLVTKFDAWSFYRNQFQKLCGGTKAIDMLAIASNRCVWAIEVKDYRVHPRTKTIELTDEVAYKVRDSLAALVAARIKANDPEEKAMSNAALAATGFAWYCISNNRRSTQSSSHAPLTRHRSRRS